MIKNVAVLVDRLSTTPNWRSVLGLALLTGFVFVSGWRQDTPCNNAETRTAEINSAMRASGDLLVPRIAGRPHLTKPPLFHWLSYGAAALSGEDGVPAVRLVSAAGAVGTVLMTYRIGVQLYNPVIGWWAAIFALTNATLLGHGHRGTFDVLLTFFVCLSISGYLSLTQDRRRSGLAILIVGLAGGFMTKGFTAWITPLIPVADHLWHHPRRRELGRTILAWLPATLAVSALWYAWVLCTVPGARQILTDVITVNFGSKRTAVAMAFHQEPFYYYLYAVPSTLLPWLLVLLPCLWQVCRESAAAWVQRNRFALLWLGGNALLLSAVPAKSTRYLVPLVPAFCLLAADAVSAMAAKGQLERPLYRRWFLGLMLALVPLTAVGLPLWLWVRLGVPAEQAVVLALVAPALPLLCAWCCRRGQPLVALGLLALGIALFAIPAYAKWMPVNDRIHRLHDSPERRQYEQRQERLRDGWKHVLGRERPAA